MDLRRKESDSAESNANDNPKVNVDSHNAVAVNENGQIVPQSEWLKQLSSMKVGSIVGEIISNLDKNGTFVRVSSQDRLPLDSEFSRNHEFNKFRYIDGGVHSKVASAVKVLDNRVYALKLIPDIDTPDKLFSAACEVGILSSLSHRNIVRYFSCWFEPKRLQSATNTTALNSEDDESVSAISSGIAALELRPSDSPGCSHFESGGETGESSTFYIPLSLDTNARQFCCLSGSVGDSGDGAEASAEQRESVEWQSFQNKAGECSYPVIFKEANLKEYPPSLIIQMEYCSTTLKHWLRQRHEYLSQMTSKKHSVDPLYRKQVRWFFDQIVLGVAYLHKNMVIHRDLKPENVLIHNALIEPGEKPDFFLGGVCTASRPSKCDRAPCYHRFCVKIGDFGLSKMVKHPTPLDAVDGGAEAGALARPSQVHTADSGTASEVFTNHEDKADIYNLGVILFEMLYTRTTTSEAMSIVDEVTDASKPGDLPAFLFEEWPFEAKLLARMLNPQPDERPAAMNLVMELAPTSEVFESELLGFALPTLNDILKEVALLRSENRRLVEKLKTLQKKKRRRRQAH